MGTAVLRSSLCLDTADRVGVFMVQAEVGRVSVVQASDDFGAVTTRLTPAEARLLATALNIQADTVERQS